MRVAALLVVQLVATVGSAEGQVRGRVIDLRTGAAVAGAEVRVIAVGAAAAGSNAGTRVRSGTASPGRQADSPVDVVTGPDGSYRLPRLRPAEYVLLVRHPGYDAANVRLLLGADRELVVDVQLVPRPIPLSPLVIPVQRGEPAARPPGTAADSLLAQLEEERRSARLRTGATSPLASLAAPEVRERPHDPGGRQPHTLHIWGSSADRGRILVDGASINAPLHLGGILPPIEPHVLAGAALRTGGAAARYDGGTSYIMDFRTRSPDAHQLSAWGDVGLLATRLGIETPFARNGSVLVGARSVNREVVDRLIDQPFDYDYGDVIARGEWRLGAGRAANALVLATREMIRIPRDLGFDEASWRNIASAVSWRPHAAGGPHVSATFSRGTADLPLLSAPDGHLEAKLDRSSVAAGSDWDLGALGIDAGVEVEHVRLSRHSEASSDPALPAVAQRVACTPSLPCAAAATTTFAAFGDVAGQLGDAFALRAGMRSVFETGTSRVRLLPRLALTWAGREGASAATLSLGRFSQTAVSERAGGIVATDTRGLRMATEYATQLELRATHTAPGLAIAATAYLRRDEATSDHSPLTTPGGELSWALDVVGSTLSGGYSFLARRESYADSTPDMQHLAFLGGSTSRGPLHLSVSGVYGTGVPLTSIVLEGVPPNQFQPTAAPDIEAEPYVRVDAALSGTWTLRLHGRQLRATPYARIVNAFSRHGALFYYQDDGRAELQPLSALPTLPVLGVRWTF